MLAVDFETLKENYFYAVELAVGLLFALALYRMGGHTRRECAFWGLTSLALSIAVGVVLEGGIAGVVIVQLTLVVVCASLGVIRGERRTRAGGAYEHGARPSPEDRDYGNSDHQDEPP